VYIDQCVFALRVVLYLFRANNCCSATVIFIDEWLICKGLTRRFWSSGVEQTQLRVSSARREASSVKATLGTCLPALDTRAWTRHSPSLLIGWLGRSDAYIASAVNTKAAGICSERTQLDCLWAADLLLRHRGVIYSSDIFTLLLLLQSQSWSRNRTGGTPLVSRTDLRGAGRWSSGVVVDTSPSPSSSRAASWMIPGPAGWLAGVGEVWAVGVLVLLLAPASRRGLVVGASRVEFLFASSGSSECS
jgi:hypothetical protein